MIRRAEQRDRDAVLGLAKNFATSFIIDEEAFHTAFESLLTNSRTHFAIAEGGDGIVVGYVLAFSHNTFYANGCVTWVEEIVVHADHQRQGLGKALMQSVEKWAATENCHLIALATRRAANFYEALDYEASATYFRKLM